MHASLFVAALAAAAPAAAWPGMTPGAAGAAAHGSHHARFHNTDMYKQIRDAAAAAQVEEKKLVARGGHGGFGHGHDSHSHNSHDSHNSAGENYKHDRSIDLLGDLLHLADGALSEVGQTIKDILSGKLGAHATTTAKTTAKTTSTSTKKTTPTTSTKKTTTTSTKKTTTTSTKKTTTKKTTTKKTTSTTSPKTTSTSTKKTSTSTKPATTTTAKPTTTSTTKTSTSTTSTATAKPTPASCSVWAQVGKAIQPTFRDGNGCSALARGAIRLGFHDAGAWNTSVAWGGADGSILLNPSELARSENNGLGDIAKQTIAWYNQWKSQGVGMADLIQFSAIVATVTCPLGPRIRFYAGRPDDSRAAVDGLLPSAFDTAPNLIALFQAKTFSAADLVALVGAHSTSEQFFADPAEAGDSQDSTPGVWDTKFYAETTQRNAPAGVYRFPSDTNLAAYSQTSGTWQAMNNQGRWNAAYANAYFRMSLLGVNNINSLTDCTASIP
ncbi:hypothetical protein SBRCBS47491_009834 [Sporothrix bragantina]|uniref:Peroxidase n=1 Tax=Sporothrix bragantina TaxID=671064 RepID=A0ABP0CY07_9PEZI